MTPKDKNPTEEKSSDTLDEICENTRALRRVANRILDHLHEYHYHPTGSYDQFDPDAVNWEDFSDSDDVYL